MSLGGSTEPSGSALVRAAAGTERPSLVTAAGCADVTPASFVDSLVLRERVFRNEVELIAKCAYAAAEAVRAGGDEADVVDAVFARAGWGAALDRAQVASFEARFSDLAWHFAEREAAA